MSCPFGSELSINILCQGLSFMKLSDTCLFYPGVVKVNISPNSGEIEKFAAEFISQHPYTFGPCPFGSRLRIHTLSDHPGFIDFEDTCLFYLGVVKVNISPSIREKLENLRRNLFLSIHTHLDPVVLAQGWESIHYLTIRVSLTLRTLAFSTSEWSKSIYRCFQKVKNIFRRRADLGRLWHLDSLLLAQSHESMDHLAVRLPLTYLTLAFSTSEWSKST